MLVLLIGLVGGVALGSLAAARGTTSSSFSVFLAHSNPSDLMIDPAGGGPGVGQPNMCSKLVDAVRRYPQVEHVESYEALKSVGSCTRGRIQAQSLDSNVVLVGSVDGLLFNQDQLRRHERPDGGSARGRRSHGHAERGGIAGTASR